MSERCRGARERWRRSHRGKKIHLTWESAELHALHLDHRFPDRGVNAPYACRWHDDHQLGETAEIHYHAGRLQL